MLVSSYYASFLSVAAALGSFYMYDRSEDFVNMYAGSGIQNNTRKDATHQKDTLPVFFFHFSQHIRREQW